MESKKDVIRFLRCTAVLLLMIAVFVILIDPFFHYHAPWFGLKAVQTKKEYQANGALEHLNYDALLVGASTSANINTDIFNEALGCHTLKAYASAGSTSVLCYYTKKAFAHQDLKYVFYSLDFMALFLEIDEDPKNNQVLYLRDKNPFNDVEYFWNIDVLAWDIPNMIAVSAHDSYDEGLAYNFVQFADTGIDTVLADYTRGKGRPGAQDEVQGEEIVAQNVDLIRGLIEAHPETEFYIVIPAESILYWDREYQSRGMERALSSLEYAVKELSVYDNVVISGGLFNDFETVMNLDNYMDLTHASYEKNCEWAQMLVNKEHLLNADNIGEELDILRRMVEDFEERCETDTYPDFLYEYTTE